VGKITVIPYHIQPPNWNTVTILVQLRVRLVVYKLFFPIFPFVILFL
jgi:hypothetical protein